MRPRGGRTVGRREDGTTVVAAGSKDRDVGRRLVFIIKRRRS